jgi:predicted nucleic acid-binding protein
MSTLLDTNICLRLVQPIHPQHIQAVAAVEAIRGAGESACLVPQVLYEFWVVCTRPLGENGLGLSTAQAQRELTMLTTVFTLFRDERAILPRWEQLIVDHEVKGKNAHDARLVAAMMRHGISRLLTFNRSDFVRFSSIEVLSPDRVVAAG